MCNVYTACTPSCCNGSHVLWPNVNPSIVPLWSVHFSSVAMLMGHHALSGIGPRATICKCAVALGWYTGAKKSIVTTRCTSRGMFTPYLGVCNRRLAGVGTTWVNHAPAPEGEREYHAREGKKERIAVETRLHQSERECENKSSGHDAFWWRRVYYVIYIYRYI